jgi:hypothetical protein
MFLHEIYRECYDPIQEAINIQLGNPNFNDYPSIETILVAAIDEKYSRLPNQAKVIKNLLYQRFTNEEIAIRFNKTEGWVRWYIKKFVVIQK